MIKAGDEVIVVKILTPRLAREARYPYKVGYIFTVVFNDESDRDEYSISAPGDESWYTEVDCVRKATKLDKVLK